MKDKILQILKSEDIDALKAALAEVQELDLSSSYDRLPLLTEQQVLLLAEVLKSNNTLTQLYLSTNQIGDIGGAAIGKALKVNHTLTKLYLGYNKIGDTGGAAIGEALKVNHILTLLDLGENQIGDTGGAAIG